MIERPIRSRGRRLQLSSSRIRAQSLSSRDTTTTTDSAEEFIEPSPSSFSRSRGRGRSRSSTPAATAVSSSTATVTGTAPIASATERVYRAVQHGLSLLNSTAPLPTELGTRFPFLNQGGRRQKRRKISKWKTIPCCLSKPDISRVPTKSAMDDLCRDGMGTLWFSRDEEPLELDLLSSTELHYLVVSLYPMLKNTSYEFCRAGGPGHQVIVPLSIDDPTRIPSNDQPFLPYFTVEMLKTSIGRKGRVYIRPLKEVRGSHRVSQVEVIPSSLIANFSVYYTSNLGVYTQEIHRLH